MRTRALILASIFPIALALVPSAAHGQRRFSDDCGSPFARGRSYSCSYDAELARQMRRDAARWRDEAREDARRARAETRALASAARAEARADSRRWDDAMSRTRLRAQELRERLRDRLETLRERRVREYRRWE